MRNLVDKVLDPARLAELTGRDVVAERLRIKDGTSLVIGLQAPDGSPDGWARILWPASRAKAQKVAERAERRGQRVESYGLRGGLLLQVGELVADPLLAAPLRAALTDHMIAQDDTVLRYNPLRRLVVKRESTSVRVFSHTDPAALPLDWTLTDAGLPIPGRLDDGARPHLAVLRFVGDTDLATTHSVDATRSIGEALAALHAVELPKALRSTLSGRAADIATQGRAHARLLDSLDESALAERVASLTAATAEWWSLAGADRHMLVHGDASPDQMILESATGRTWITDLERACLADPAVDLGSYLANCPEDEGVALLQGYAAGGGEMPEEEALEAAKARAILLAAIDPVRRASVDWVEDVSARLDALEAVLR